MTVYAMADHGGTAQSYTEVSMMMMALRDELCDLNGKLTEPKAKAHSEVSN